MATKALICNMALAHAGVNARIQDVDNEGSAEAQQCRLFYDHCQGIIMEAMPWPFATVRAELQSIGTPYDSWAFRYKYPADCVRANAIVVPGYRTPPQNGKIPFRVVKTQDAAGKAIMCDMANAVLEYNVMIVDPSLFTFAFTQAFSLALAAHIATPLRVDPAIAQAAEQRFDTWLNEAAGNSLREQREDMQPDSEFLMIRG